MKYDFLAISDSEVPRASNPLFQHLLDTYAGETNKVISVWRCFSPGDLGFRPHEKSSTLADILKHQLLSERRFFGEFVGSPEPPANQVLPASLELEACTRRMAELARPRLAFFAVQPAEWWMADVPFFGLTRQRHLGLLATRAAHLPSPHPAHGLPAAAEQGRALGLRPHRRPDLGWR